MEDSTNRHIVTLKSPSAVHAAVLTDTTQIRKLFIHVPQTPPSEYLNLTRNNMTSNEDANEQPAGINWRQLIEDVESLLQACASTLETLCLVHWDSVPASPTNQFPLRIPALVFPKLSVLFLVGSIKFVAEGPDVAAGFPSLKHLDLAGNETAKTLISSWAARAPQLAQLCISVGSRDSEQAYEEFGRLVCTASGVGQPFPGLQKIEVQPCRLIRTDCDPNEVVCSDRKQAMSIYPNGTRALFTKEDLEELLGQPETKRQFLIRPTLDLTEKDGWDGEATCREAMRDNGAMD